MSGDLVGVLDIWSNVKSQESIEIPIKDDLVLLLGVEFRKYAIKYFEPQLNDANQLLANLIFILQSSPISPFVFNDDIAKIQWDYGIFIEDHKNHSASSDLKKLCTILAKISSSTRDALTLFENEASKYNDVALAVPSKVSIDIIQTHLANEDLTGVTAVTVNELRKASKFYDAIFIYGDIGRINYHPKFEKINDRRKKNAWLVKYPFSKVIVMMGDQKTIEANKGSQLRLKSKAQVETSSIIVTNTQNEVEGLDLEFLQFKESLKSLVSNDTHEVTTARIIRFSDGKLIFESKSGQHKPIGLRFENGVPRLSRVDSVAEGEWLVTFGDRGTDKALKYRAEEALRNKHGSHTFENALRASTALKYSFRSYLKLNGKDHLIKSLSPLGLSEQQVNSFMISINNPSYIAPLRENFFIFADFFDVPEIKIAYDDIEKYRTELRLAGRSRFNAVDAYLKEHPAEIEELNKKGVVTFTDTNFGIVRIALVESVSNSFFEIPSTFIISPQREDYFHSLIKNGINDQ